MGTINPTVYRLSENAVRISYANMANTDVGVPIGKHWHDYIDRSVQISGTFGANGSVTIEGSNNGGASYTPVADVQGTAITKTNAAVEQIVEVMALTRPTCTIGDNNTAINVDIFLRRARSGQEL